MFDRYPPINSNLFEENREWVVLWRKLGLRETAFIKYPRLTRLRPYDLKCIGISNDEVI